VLDKVSKETFLASKEARKGRGGRKNEIEKKGGRGGGGGSYSMAAG
jgi:hypothetical protein